MDSYAKPMDAAAAGCCCCRLLLGIRCCRLLAAAAGWCCCWLLMLQAAAAAPVSLETTCIVVFSEGQKMWKTCSAIEDQKMLSLFTNSYVS